MNREPRDLRERTLQYALRIVRLYSALPRAELARTLGKQALRSGTSVGAHYREAYFGKSDADMACKMQGALQELHETGYWLELLAAAGIVPPKRLAPLMEETRELIAIFVSVTKKIKSRGRS